MITTYLILTAIVVVIIVFMNLPLPGSKKPEPIGELFAELEENPLYKALQALQDAQQKMATLETVDGEIIDGYDKFGFDVTNPIPINTIFAEKSYLGRLRTEDGIKVQYERIGSFYAPNIKYPVDGYQISAKGDYICTLYLCPYCESTSELAPKGFKLIKRRTNVKNDKDKTKNQKLIEAIGFILLEYGILLMINLVVIGVGTALVRMFDLQYFLLVSSVNALWMHGLLLQLIKKYLW